MSSAILSVITVLSGVTLARSFPFVVQKLFIFLDFLSTRNDLITKWLLDGQS